MPLDTYDLKLLALLQADGKCPQRQLAEAVTCCCGASSNSHPTMRSCAAPRGCWSSWRRRSRKWSGKRLSLQRRKSQPLKAASMPRTSPVRSWHAFGNRKRRPRHRKRIPSRGRSQNRSRSKSKSLQVPSNRTPKRKHRSPSKAATPVTTPVPTRLNLQPVIVKTTNHFSRKRTTFNRNPRMAETPTSPVLKMAMRAKRAPRKTALPPTQHRHKLRHRTPRPVAAARRRTLVTMYRPISPRTVEPTPHRVIRNHRPGMEGATLRQLERPREPKTQKRPQPVRLKVPPPMNLAKQVPRVSRAAWTKWLNWSPLTWEVCSGRPSLSAMERRTSMPRLKPRTRGR